MRKIPQIVLIAAVLLLPGANLQAADSSVAVSQEKGLAFALARPEMWRDPHGLRLLGALSPWLERTRGRQEVQKLVDAMAAQACLHASSGNTDGWRRVQTPYYPAAPTCSNEWGAHATAVALLGLYALDEQGYDLTAFGKEPVREYAKRLRLEPGLDTKSIGLKLQALLLAGIPADAVWRTSDGGETSFKQLFAQAVTAWETQLRLERPPPGETPSDKLLHLAPALITLQQRQPEAFAAWRLQPALERVFSWYASLAHGGGFWFAPGESFATGHLLEHYAMAQRPLPAQQAPALLALRQWPSGRFRLGQDNFFGAQVHGLIGLQAMEEAGKLHLMEADDSVADAMYRETRRSPQAAAVMERYEAGADFKALARHDTASGRHFYGFSHHYDTPQQAADAALAYCHLELQRADIQGECRLLLLGATDVRHMSQAALERQMQRYEQQYVERLRRKVRAQYDRAAWVRLETILQRLGRYQESEDVLIGPARAGDPEAMNALAYHWGLLEKNLPQALEMAKKAVGQKPNEPRYRDTLAELLRMTGSPDQARKEFEASLALQQNPIVMEHYADMLRDLGQTQAAKSLYLRAKDSSPDILLRQRVEKKLQEAP